MRRTLLFVLFLCSFSFTAFAQAQSPEVSIPAMERQADDLYWQNPASACRLYLEAANLGSPYSEFKIGDMYTMAIPGLPIRPDPAQAFVWYQKAAEQGYAPGQFMVGQAYYYGRGTERNHEKAFAWYMKAADQGYVPAELEVASYYYSGEGMAAPNYVQTMSWYKKPLRMAQ